MIHQSAVRCRKIVQNLLSFRGGINPSANWSVLILSSVRPLTSPGYQLRTSNIEVTTLLEPKLPNAMVDSHQLEQVFINILNNGRQAIETHQPKDAHPHQHRASRRQTQSRLPRRRPGHPRGQPRQTV